MHLIDRSARMVMLTENFLNALKAIDEMDGLVVRKGGFWRWIFTMIVNLRKHIVRQLFPADVFLLNPVIEVTAHDAHSGVDTLAII